MNKILISIIFVLLVLVICIVSFQNSKIEILQSELKNGKETTFVKIIIHDTIRDTIPFAQIVYTNKIITTPKIIAIENNIKDTFKIIDTTSCFNFTKSFEEGTVNVEMCSKHFKSKYEDISANMWFIANPDSIKTIFRVDTLKLIQTVPEPHKFWKILGIGAACFGTGYFIAKVTK